MKIIRKNKFLYKFPNGHPIVVISFQGKTPVYQDYQSSNILSTIPAWQSEDGKIFAVSNGLEIKLSKRMTIWPITCGSKFTLANGENIFLNRKPFGQREYLWHKGVANYSQLHNHTLSDKRVFFCLFFLTAMIVIAAIHRTIHQLLINITNHRQQAIISTSLGTTCLNFFRIWSFSWQTWCPISNWRHFGLYISYHQEDKQTHYKFRFHNYLTFMINVFNTNYKKLIYCK